MQVDQLNVPELLREVACQLTEFEIGVTFLRTPMLIHEPHLEGPYLGTSPYICDRLNYAFDKPGCGREARDFLYSLGMGGGYSVFGGQNNEGYFSPDQQHERAAWLYFAADLWEEWGGDAGEPAT